MAVLLVLATAQHDTARGARDSCTLTGRTRYAKALSDQDGMPLLTIGLQTGDVPRSWDAERRPAQQGWRIPWTQNTRGRWAFPFFACPECGSPLVLVETGTPLDRLDCATDDKGCGWSYGGWVGTKEGLKKSPPHIFLPVTESLHQ
ncbi:MAG: hypothetical protein KDK70_37070, partial [Myxococcales bacterium]|nr:hypothetical protein [Myxococcales bacterium]